MKHLLVVIFTLIFFVQNSNAQNSKLVGSWLMTKTEVGGEIQKPYFITEFNEDGKFVVMGMEFGTWEYNKKNNSIILKSEMDKDWNSERKIVNLTDKELVTTIDDARLFYKKVDMAKITESNKNSGLMGMWEFKDVPYSEASTLVTFTEPDEFSIIEKQEGMTANLSGTWIFDNQEKSLIMIGLRGEDTFNGNNKVLKIDGETIELENNGTVFKANKKAENTSKIERLTFTEAEFFTEDGDYKYYDEEEKLPWRNWDELKMNLLSVKQLVYNFSTLINGTEAFENKTLTADVKATLEEERFTIDNIFIGFDRYNLPEDSEFYENTEYWKPLYPLVEETYRIVGNEQITTPAGTFDCTVLEVVNISGVMKKLWMINDKVGVYAKIIEDDPDEIFGHYSIYELQEIKATE
ncbi:MAG: hypothetical protein GQ525_07085 [Draconibacterium sp.]|nr:hypothetical protein [Draconibacterium sp.]